MLMPIVIADAGPLIALARIDQLSLLPALFDEVVVTEAVANELLAGVFTETAPQSSALRSLVQTAAKGRSACSA